MTTTSRPRRKLFTKDIVVPAIWASFRKLDPRVQLRNPVMFVVEVGSVITTGIFLSDLFRGRLDGLWFTGVVAFWLWLTVIFANLAEAVAEGRGKAQANALRATRSEMMARLLVGEGREESVPAAQLHPGDLVVCEAGDLIPGDGDVVEGVASVDESAITGESAPVIRESGGDRSAVTGGTRVLSDRIVVRITQEPGASFLDRMIALVEGTSRRKTPNEIALNILIAGLTIVFLVVTATLRPMVTYSGTQVSLTVLIALLVALIPTTIGALLSAIGIAGMDRLVQRNVLAMSGRAVEAAGDVDTLLLDKTGTITLGNRQATEFIPAAGVTERELADAAQLASLADETPEGRSIVVLAKERFGFREREEVARGLEFIPFSAETRMSGVQTNGTSIRKGASDAIQAWVGGRGGAFPDGLQESVDVVARAGGTPLVVARDAQALGVIHLKDVVKEGMTQRFAELRQMGIRTVMITGDNRLTAAAIAAEAGVDDFLAQATPEDKMALIREEQGQGAPGGHDGRRHQRRPGAGPGRRGRGHEHRHLGRQGGREHGRPRLRPHQAHRDRRGRQAAAHHPRRPHDLLDRERRRQVLRDPAGDLRRELRGRAGRQGPARRPERDGPRHPAERDHLGDRLQRAHHPRPGAAGPARRALPGHRRHPAAPPQPPDLRRRRRHRAVHRHQAHRPDHPQPLRGLTPRSAFHSSSSSGEVAYGGSSWLR